MVEIRNLTKSYDNRVIFDDFSYHFDEKGLYAIVGESGRGKTTLLRIIAHLESFQKGTLKSPKRTAYSFQEYRLFERLNVYANIEMVAFRKVNEEDKKKILALLARLHLSDAIDLYPSQLSGGMRQRVSLIRAFASDAPLVLLDEPFKELDQSLIDTVVEIIQEIASKKLVIFTAHDEAFADRMGAKIIHL